jgi:hypothetical protein
MFQTWRTRRNPTRNTRPTRPTLESLEARDCPTTLSFGGGILTITGDARPSDVQVIQNDTANTIEVDYDTRQGPQAQIFDSSAVQRINAVFTGNGASILYDLASDNDFSKTLSVDLRGPNESAAVDLTANGSATLHADFRLLMNGRGAHDRLAASAGDVTAATTLDIDPDVMLRMALNGGARSRLVTSEYVGHLNGYLDLRNVGGQGANRGSVTVDILPGSFGSATYNYLNPRAQPFVDNLAKHPLFLSIEPGSLLGVFPTPLYAAPAASITVNGVPLSPDDMANLEAELRQLDPAGVGLRVLPSAFWYDSVSGAVGLMGGPTETFGPAGLQLGGPLPANASHGTTRVYVNGRRITTSELAFLERLVGSIPPGHYFIEANGDAGRAGGPVLVNFIQRAQQLGQHAHIDPLSTYDLTGIGVLSDGHGGVDILESTIDQHLDNPTD